LVIIGGCLWLIIVCDGRLAAAAASADATGRQVMKSELGCRASREAELTHLIVDCFHIMTACVGICQTWASLLVNQSVHQLTNK